MQETRQNILEILREIEQGTVDDIVEKLCQRRGEITAVTVRHHLARLQQDELIDTPHLRHRSTPGRPQHIYILTEKAQKYFPDNYKNLAIGLIKQMQTKLSPDDVTVILEAVADDMADKANIEEEPLEQRLHSTVLYLSEHGYKAELEKTDDGYLVHTKNCPYEGLHEGSSQICEMDVHLLTSLLGKVPNLVKHNSNGKLGCTYLVAD
jgi:predicted ArsR family transcriptional regulator